MVRNVCTWVSMGVLVWKNKKQKEVWWCNQGEDVHRLMGEISNKNMKTVIFQIKVYMGSDGYI